MTIAETLIRHLENKEYDKFYDLYENLREQSTWYTDSRGAIIETLLPKEDDGNAFRKPTFQGNVIEKDGQYYIIEGETK